MFCILGTPVLILGIAWVWPVFNEMKRAAAFGTVSSFVRLAQRNPPEVNATDRWRKLDHREFLKWYERWEEEVDKNGSRVSSDGRVLNPWGGGYQLAYRKGKDGEVAFVVWTNGADGRSGTADDVSKMTSGLKVGDVDVRASLVRDGVWEELTIEN
ncbi:MAG: hypothetical protein KDA68_17195 [Planctomycetaceae bacterium]|nr:hypothetical protein [Planctomycetaceae bacterium]